MEMLLCHSKDKEAWERYLYKTRMSSIYNMSMQECLHDLVFILALDTRIMGAHCVPVHKANTLSSNLHNKLALCTITTQ